MKREYEGEGDFQTDSSKRVAESRDDLTITIPTHLVQVGNASTAMKILIPSASCGPLIGKGGANIAELNKITSARIRISPNRTVFPGTNDRVAVLTGPGEVVMNAIDVVVKRLFEIENENLKANDPSGASTQSESRIRIVIPFAAAGVIIGRGGDHIRQIRQLHSCRIKVGDAVDPYGTKERMITILSDSPSPVIKGMQQILLLLMKEPAIGSYASLDAVYPSSEGAPPMGGAYMDPYDPRSAGGPGYHPAGYPSGLPPQGFEYDHRGYEVGRRDPSPRGAQYPYDNQAAYGGYQQAQKLPSSNRQARNPTAYPYAGAATRSEETQSSSVPSSTGAGGPGAMDILPPMYQTDGTSITMTLGVPDLKIGVLIGRGGSIVKEIKALSGVNMTLSQKGDTIPGTAYRKVTVVGTQIQVQHAQSMIMQRLAADSTLTR